MKKDFALHSGERIGVVDTAIIPADHLARYKYVVRDNAQHRRPLVGADVFCGSGYGSNILASGLNATVWGIDGSAEAVTQASKSFSRSNLFFSSKLFPFQLPLQMFDFIASMESVEHVRDYVGFCSVLCASLKIGGRLYISAPSEDKLVLSRLNYIWHYQHFRPGELESLLVPFGMKKLRGLSSSICVTHDGNAICTYSHQFHGEELLEENVGDTHFYVFERIS